MKPYDLALFSDPSVSSVSESSSAHSLDNVALALFNHKLLTTKRGSSEKRFGEKLDDHPGLKFMWKTETRPFQETIALFIPGPDQERKLQEAFYKEKYTEIVKKLNLHLNSLHLKKTNEKEDESLNKKESKRIFVEGLGSELDFDNLTLEQVIILTVIKQKQEKEG